MKKAIAAFTILVALVGYSLSNLYQSHRVRIPRSNLYVKIPHDSAPRLWANAVEFDHVGWQEICFVDNDGKAQCQHLSTASPTVNTPPPARKPWPKMPTQYPPDVIH